MHVGPCELIFSHQCVSDVFVIGWRAHVCGSFLRQTAELKNSAEQRSVAPGLPLEFQSSLFSRFKTNNYTLVSIVSLTMLGVLINLSHVQPFTF